MKKWLDQYKTGGSANSLNRTVTCSNCGWSWRLSDGGKDPMTCHKCGGDVKMQQGGQLDEYQLRGEVQQFIPTPTRAVSDNTRSQQFMPISDQQLFQNRMRFMPQPVQPQFRQGQRETPHSQQLYKERKAEELKRQVQRNSPLAQTMASFTPGNNIDAGVLGAEAFVNINPLTGAITSTNRLANAISNPMNNVYWNQNNSVGQNALGVVGAIGDASMVSPYFKGVGTSIMQNPSISNKVRTIRNNIDAQKIRYKNYSDKATRNILLGSVDEGNKWSADWFSHPETIKKYDDFVIPDSKNPFLETLINVFKVEPGPAGNAARKSLRILQSKGKLTIPEKKIINNPLYLLKNNPFVTEGYYNPYTNKSYVDVYNPRTTPSEIVNTVIHENAHSVTGGTDGINPKFNHLFEEAFHNGFDDYSRYLIEPTESYARINELRHHFGLKPGVKISNKAINKIIEQGKSGNTPVDRNWFYLIKDKSGLKNLFNNAPAVITGAVGIPSITNSLQQEKNGGPIVTPRGQWDYPGQTTIIPSNQITMQGVDYPVLGVDNTGHQIMMQPGGNYTFPGQYVTEYPMMQGGGLVKYQSKGEVKTVVLDDRNMLEKFFNLSEDEVKKFNLPIDVYNSYQSNSKSNKGKTWGIASKKNARAYFFDANGNLAVEDEVGFGKDRGEQQPIYYKVMTTPSGTYKMYRPQYNAAVADKLKKGYDSNNFFYIDNVDPYKRLVDVPGSKRVVKQAVHGIPTHLLQERSKYFGNNTLDDNFMSAGCINCKRPFLDNPYFNSFKEGLVYVLPEKQIGGGVYQVREGDNLSTIAKRNNIPLNTLIAANKIQNPDLIHVGQKINIPQNRQQPKVVPNVYGITGSDAKSTLSQTNSKSQNTTANNKILTYASNPEYFDSRTIISQDPKYNAQIKKGVYAGTHGYDPTTGYLVRLKTPVKVDAATREMSTEEWGRKSDAQKFSSRTPAGEQVRKNYVAQDMQKVVTNPITYAPGMVGVGMLAAPLLSAPLLGSSTALSGLTAGNIINTGFGIHSAKTLYDDLKSGYYNSDDSWQNKTLNAGFTGLGLLGVPGLGSNVFKTALKPIKYANNLIVDDFVKGRDLAFPKNEIIKNGQIVKNSREFFKIHDGKPLKKSEINFLNKELEQRGILESQRAHPLDPRPHIFKRGIVPEDYNIKSVVKNFIPNIIKGQKYVDSQITMGKTRINSFNQYLGLPTENTAYRIHSNSFKDGKGLVYTIPQKNVDYTSSEFLSKLNKNEIGMMNTIENYYRNPTLKNKKILHSEFNKAYGQNIKFKDFDPDVHINLNSEISDYGKPILLDNKTVFPSWDYITGTGGNAPFIKEGNKITLKDVWDINPLSRIKKLPEFVKKFDAKHLMGAKEFELNNTYRIYPKEIRQTFDSGGEMIRRADGSYSRRGLWDNIRANRGSGKKPTKQMLEQERKIRNKKQEGGEEFTYWRTNEPMVNDPSMDAISKVLLQRNLDKNFMQRAAGFGYQGGIPTKYIPEEDPNSDDMSSLLMGTGGNRVFPTIIQTAPQQLSFQPNQREEYLEAPSWDVADYFATKGYKRAVNDMYGMEYGNGGYVVRRSNDRKGKTHVVTGPDGTKKYFGDPNMGERSKSKYGKEAFYARHKSNLAKNPYFRAYAKATWEDGGETFAIGGQSTLNPITSKDNRNWLDFLKN